MKLTQYLVNKPKETIGYKPKIFNLKNKSQKKDLSKLFEQKKIKHIVDDYKQQLEELFAINNPKLVFSLTFNVSFKNYLKKILAKPLEEQGVWVYFPWSFTLVHILTDKDFQKVRMARNKNLINEKEQNQFYKAVVGIAGLSVGNSVALTIVMEGGAKHIKLADHDTLSLSNTNRIRTSITNLGLPKVEMTARQIYELNPYAKVEIISEGLNEKNIGKFCNGLNVIIDEVDNLAIKYLLRIQAKNKKLPVVMAADNGDNGIIDIERYDLNPKTKFFHGRMGKTSYKELISLDKMGIGKMITKLVRPENVTPRMQKSLLEIGKSIISWPQLGGAATLNGSAVAYCVRQIVTGQPIENNRAIISLDEKLEANFHSKKSRLQRQRATLEFKKIFKL
jgi:molybdopterin/thiamine biosynthesis adenylyltransferase